MEATLIIASCFAAFYIMTIQLPQNEAKAFTFVGPLGNLLMPSHNTYSNEPDKICSVKLMGMNLFWQDKSGLTLYPMKEP